MMIHLDQLNASAMALRTLSNAPGRAVANGENRLQATSNTGIDTGVHAHAAVRMHVSPVFGKFWAYCPKSKTHHFQHWKVAN